MLINFKIRNYKVFDEEVSMSFEADMRIKKFLSNTIEINNHNILKVAGVYGPNNTGKTCLLLALRTIRDIMLKENDISFNNSFKDNKVTELEIEYEIDKRFYRYYVKYNSVDNLYIYERLEEKKGNSYHNLLEKKEYGLFIRLSERMNKTEKQFYSDNYPIFMMLKLENTALDEAQKDYLSFAKSIELIRMDRALNISKTISLLKEDEEAKKFIISFIKNCDLNIEDYGYSDNIISDIDITKELSFINQTNINKDSFKLWSKHHGFTVPSAFFDSVGTQKIVALAGHIYDAFKNGKILLIDEIDSSLHHVITRAIIALFNNVLNNKAQLIFATHDALLMDVRRLFRKEQIWLTDIDESGKTKLIQLSEFTSRDENGIRGDEEIIDYYLKGRFGGIPTPDLFDTLFSLLGSDSDGEKENINIG